MQDIIIASSAHKQDQKTSQLSEQNCTHGCKLDLEKSSNSEHVRFRDEFFWSMFTKYNKILGYFYVYSYECEWYTVIRAS